MNNETFKDKVARAKSNSSAIRESLALRERGVAEKAQAKADADADWLLAYTGGTFKAFRNEKLCAFVLSYKGGSVTFGFGGGPQKASPALASLLKKKKRDFCCKFFPPSYPYALC